MNAAAAIALTFLTTGPSAPAPPDTKARVEKGLKWLVGQQKADGHWAGRDDRFPTTATALAGLALLMEGSTLRDGPRAEELRRAVAWVEGLAGDNGLLARGGPSEATAYVPGHAFALLFLVSAYDVDDDADRRERLDRLIRRAIEFAAEAQGKRGGWGTTSARDRPATEDSSSTLLMLQALFAARASDFEVPRSATTAGTDFLALSTNATGTVSLSPTGAGRAGRAQLTAGAAAALLARSGPRPPAFARWLTNLKSAAAIRAARTDSTAYLTYYQMARAAYSLGETGHHRLDPAARPDELFRWSDYRAAAFAAITEEQTADGSWADRTNGPVYSTALALIVLQLDNGYLPAFSR